MSKAMSYFYLVVEGGTEIEQSKHYDTAEERDNAAAETWGEVDHLTVNIFWLDVISPTQIKTGAYLEGDL